MKAKECKAKNCLFMHKASGKPNCYYHHPKVPLRHLTECPAIGPKQHSQPIVVGEGENQQTLHTINGRVFITPQEC